MNTETSKAGNTIWAFDLGKPSIAMGMAKLPEKSARRESPGRVVAKPTGDLSFGKEQRSEIKTKQ